eukprot:4370299-Pyramimonas_sp.AAC.1
MSSLTCAAKLGRSRDRDLRATRVGLGLGVAHSKEAHRRRIGSLSEGPRDIVKRDASRET